MKNIAQLGVLGFSGIAIILTFAYIVVASTLDLPGIRPVPEEIQTQATATLFTLTAALGGAVAAVFGGKNGGDNGGQ